MAKYASMGFGGEQGKKQLGAADQVGQMAQVDDTIHALSSEDQDIIDTVDLFPQEPTVTKPGTVKQEAIRPPSVDDGDDDVIDTEDPFQDIRAGETARPTEGEEEAYYELEGEEKYDAEATYDTETYKPVEEGQREFMEVPTEVEPPKPSLGRPYEPGDIAYLSQKKEFMPYYSHQVRKYSEMYYRALGIERPDPDAFPVLNVPKEFRARKGVPGETTLEQIERAFESISGPYSSLKTPTKEEIERSKELRPYGYAASERSQGLVPPLGEEEKVIDLGENYGPQPERWRGETLGMERPRPVLSRRPDFHDVIKAIAIMVTHDTLSVSDFMTDITAPEQQASVARVHNDLLWASTVAEEYGKEHGTAWMFALGLIGGTYGLLGSPLESAVLFHVTQNIGQKVANKMLSPFTTSILQKYGTGVLGSFLVRVPIFAANFAAQFGANAAKRELEWNLVGPRLAKEMGVDVEDLDSESIMHGIAAGLFLGIGAMTSSNAKILADAMPSTWNQAMSESYSKAYANILNEKTEKLMTEFFKSKPGKKHYTAQDWQDFIVDKFGEPNPTIQDLGGIDIFDPRMPGAAKGTAEDTSILNLENRYKINVDSEGRAIYDQDQVIKNEAQLGDEYGQLVKDRLVAEKDPDQAVSFLGRMMLKISDIASAIENIGINKLYKGLTRDESKILYKNSVDEGFNRAYYDALVGKNPELFASKIKDINGDRFIRNALDMNKMIVDGLRKRGVAVSELEEGYIRQTHNTYKIVAVKEQDWVDYTYQRLNHNKSFKDIFDKKYINSTIQELDKDITETKAALKENENIKADVTIKKTNLERLKAMETRTAEQDIEYRQARLAYREAREQLKENNKKMRALKNSLPEKNIKKSLRDAEKYKKTLARNLDLNPEQQEAMAKAILGDTYKKITLEGKEGILRTGGTGRYHKQRELHFKDFDGWNSYQQDFGHEMSALQATIHHLQASSKKLAALEMLGPTPNALRSELAPIIENLHGQKLSRAARNQLELFDAVMDNILEYHAINQVMESSVGFRIIDNMNAISSTDLLKNVARFGVVFEPMQLTFWGQEFGLIDRGLVRSQFEGVKNSLKALGALGKKGAEMLHLIPRADQEEMTLAGFLFHNNNRYIQAKETNMNLNQGVVKFSRQASKVFGSDLSQEIGHTNAATLWTYRIGQMIREKQTWGTMSKDVQRVLRRYGVNEGEWNGMLTESNRGMMENYFAGTKKADSIKAKSFSAMKMLNEATTEAEADLARKMYYAQTNFTRLANMQSDPLINAAVKSMIGAKNPKSTLGKIANRMIEGFFTFSGYNNHLRVQLRQLGLETGNRMFPGAHMALKWYAKMIGASYLTNTMTDILRGKEPELSTQDLVRASVTVGGYGLLANIIWEAIEATMDDQEVGLKKGLDIGSQAMPLGVGYFWNKGSNAAMAFNEFMGGDNARAMYHARKAVPFINWLPTDLMANRLLIDNIFYNLDPSAAYRDWLMESVQAARTGKAFDPNNRPGGWVIDNAPIVLNR